MKINVWFLYILFLNLEGKNWFLHVQILLYTTISEHYFNEKARGFDIFLMYVQLEKDGVTLSYKKLGKNCLIPLCSLLEYFMS